MMKLRDVSIVGKIRTYILVNVASYENAEVDLRKENLGKFFDLMGLDA
jgi:hypothetical protein